MSSVQGCPHRGVPLYIVTPLHPLVVCVCVCVCACVCVWCVDEAIDGELDGGEEAGIKTDAEGRRNKETTSEGFGG